MNSPSRRWALVLHGGAKEIARGQEAANRNGLLEALEAGRLVLDRGGSALDAAEGAVRVLERLPVFNAGHGSVLNDAGEIEMDASVMDGATLDIGAVAALKGFKHPVSIARRLLREEAILLVGEGAGHFAAQAGAEPSDSAAFAASGDRGCDTVGCVAMDVEGNFAVASSTGGLQGSIPGRVGDTPLPGCGFYADNCLGAVAFSGHGEGIARLLLAARVMADVATQGAEASVRRAVAEMSRVTGEAGGIAIDRGGAIGWWHNSAHFPVGLLASDMSEPRSWLGRHEAAR